MKRFFLFVVVALFSANLYAGLFSSYNYITADELLSWLKSKKQFYIIDIQPKKDFDDEHIVGAIPTYAFPAKTAEEKKRLDPAVEKVKKDNLPVVVVCPRGKSGAENAYDYIKSKGIDEKRLYLLKDGMSGWKYDEYSEPKR